MIYLLALILLVIIIGIVLLCRYAKCGFEDKNGYHAKKQEECEEKTKIFSK